MVAIKKETARIEKFKDGANDALKKKFIKEKNLVAVGFGQFLDAAAIGGEIGDFGTHLMQLPIFADIIIPQIAEINCAMGGSCWRPVYSMLEHLAAEFIGDNIVHLCKAKDGNFLTTHDSTHTWIYSVDVSVSSSSVPKHMNSKNTTSTARRNPIHRYWKANTGLLEVC